MSEVLHVRSPIAAGLMPDRSIASGADPDTAVAIREVTDCALVQIVARKGQAAALCRRLEPVLGATVSGKPLTAAGDRALTLCATGPLELWALSETQSEAALLGILGDAAKEAAYLYGQSHGRVVLRLSGARAPDVLAKGCPLDLHPSAFPAPGAGHTSIEKMPVLVVKRDDGPTFDLAVGRSYARSFAHWLCEAAREFGYRAEPA